MGRILIRCFKAVHKRRFGESDPSVLASLVPHALSQRLIAAQQTHVLCELAAVARLEHKTGPPMLDKLHVAADAT